MDGEAEEATLSVGVAAASSNVNVSETVPELAVRVTDCAFATGNSVAVNVVLVALSGTVTVAGTVT